MTLKYKGHLHLHIYILNLATFICLLKGVHRIGYSSEVLKVNLRNQPSSKDKCRSPWKARFHLYYPNKERLDGEDVSDKMFFSIRAVIFSKWESNHVKFLKGQIPDKPLDYTFEYVI